MSEPTILVKTQHQSQTDSEVDHIATQGKSFNPGAK